jgi:Nod factor-specific ABC transporter NodJ protein
MNGLIAVYLRELLILKRRIPMLIGSMSVSPLLYLLAFGFGLGKNLSFSGHTYLEYLLPGLVALSSMTQSFAIAGEINVARFYWKIFEEFQASPIHEAAYVGGEVLAGMTRGLIATVVILIFGGLFGVVLNLSAAFWLAVIANSFVFSSLALFCAMVVREHSSQMMLNTFLITPMAFLGGTFFPVVNMPEWAQYVMQALPITHASQAIRDAALNQGFSAVPYMALLIMGGVFFWLAVKRVCKACV